MNNDKLHRMNQESNNMPTSLYKLLQFLLDNDTHHNKLFCS